MFRRFRREDGNLIVALAAVVISVCALYISVQEVRIMRMQQRISLYPYVKVSQSYGAGGFSITARNSGSGLAKINFFELSVGDKTFESWIDLINEIYPENESIGYNIVKSNNILDEMIIPEEEVLLFSVPWNDETRSLVPKMEKLTIRICYSSLLDECWRVENKVLEEVECPCGDWNIKLSE